MSNQKNNLIKSEFNFAGNKYKYMEIINNIVKNKKYDAVIDAFMGSGNILLNITCECDNYIGNDKTKLIPYVYKTIIDNDITFKLDKFKKIINKFNSFKSKEDYYTFRKYWNEKYLNNKFDTDFIYETLLLLKMCSNSMIRYNQKGEFNQGFRGLMESQKDGFFREHTLLNIVDKSNLLAERLKSKTYTFYNVSFENIKEIYNKNNLLIFDPPYILEQQLYSQDFNKEKYQILLDILTTTSNDFIYFDYISNENDKNELLEQFIKDNKFDVVELNSSASNGQGRLKTKTIKEILVTNIK